MTRPAAVKPGIDFSGIQQNLAGEPTQVLVLGTAHLTYFPKEAFTADHLSLVLERLQEFAPDLIAIESISGRTCDHLRRWDALYDGVADRYCVDPGIALEGLGMTMVEAAVAVEQELGSMGDAASPAKRRRMAALFYGAGEPWSASLQWSKLPEDQRKPADGVSEALAQKLDRYQRSRNETNLIAIELARRLGLEHLATMDDHTADLIQARAPETLGPTVSSVWSTDVPGEAEIEAKEETFLGSAEGVLAGYRYMNSPDYQHATIAADFGLAAATPDHDAVARHYVAWWQARGMRMAANLIEAAGNRPGAKVLVIVGASHKAYFDAYLEPMQDVELVSVDAVLAGEGD
ncbi:hypothetical protein ABI59_16450 [Acidobacteria bacterium Mor1]|nr:hypothetical protein ABI59_16450 [Acidobacteria bacterium Mor1]